MAKVSIIFLLPFNNFPLNPQQRIPYQQQHSFIKNRLYNRKIQMRKIIF